MDEYMKERSNDINSMTVGIVGCGKMGSEIFQLLLEKILNIVVVCHTEEGKEQNKNKFEKNLKRKLNCGLIEEEKYNTILSCVVFSSNINDLKDCDIVIESVTENLDVKKQIVKRIEEVVRKECIIATNTSSIPLNEIFSDCKDKTRCLGVHFFFPVKINKSVELNCIAEYSANNLSLIKKVMDYIDVQYIELDEENWFVINKIISTVVSFSVHIYFEGNVSIIQINDIVRKNIMVLGPFDLVDSTGFDIIGTSLVNYERKSGNRYTHLYACVRELMSKILSEGYKGNKNSGFLLYDSDKSKNDKLDDDKIERIIQRIKAVLINDICYHCKCGTDSKKLFSILKTVLGFKKSITDMYNELGKKKISELLAQEKQNSDLDFFNEEDLYKYMEETYE